MEVANCRYIKNRFDNPATFNEASFMLDYAASLIFSNVHYIIDGKHQTVKPNSFLIIKKGTTYQRKNQDGVITQAWVHFNADKNDIKWLTELGIKFNVPVELSNIDEPARIMREMHRVKYSSNLHSDEEADLYLRLLLLKVSDICNAEKQSKDRGEVYKHFLKLRAQIYSHPQKIRSIDEYAQSVSMSTSHFQHKYKQFFGNGIKKDITLSRIEYAKYLLTSTHSKINTISDMCGYENDVHFMRIFKEHTGLTPTQYRIAVLRSDDKFEEHLKFSPFYGKKI